jgi:succinyl-CoA synthetase beta subunit
MFTRKVLRTINVNNKNLLVGPSRLGGTRLVSIHEDESMDMMRSFDIPVPKSGMAANVEEANQVYKTIIGEGNDCVIKAMVLAGGRGKGQFDNGFKGGVRVCSKPGDVAEFAKNMLGANLITKETTAAGLPCYKVMLIERMYIRREMYISIILDLMGPTFTVSPAGGASLNEIAAATPELIFRQLIDVNVGVTDEQSNYLATSLGFVKGTAAHKECKGIIEKLYKLFRAKSCTLLEVNSMAETEPDGRVVLCDGKINLEDKNNTELKTMAFTIVSNACIGLILYIYLHSSVNVK